MGTWPAADRANAGPAGSINTTAAASAARSPSPSNFPDTRHWRRSAGLAGEDLRQGFFSDMATWKIEVSQPEPRHREASAPALRAAPAHALAPAACGSVRQWPRPGRTADHLPEYSHPERLR